MLNKKNPIRTTEGNYRIPQIQFLQNKIFSFQRATLDFSKLRIRNANLKKYFIHFINNQIISFKKIL